MHYFYTLQFIKSYYLLLSPLFVCISLGSHVCPVYVHVVLLLSSVGLCIVVFPHSGHLTLGAWGYSHIL